MMVACLTDNKQRTVAEVRSLFDKRGGRLGESGSVAWMFEQKGVIVINKGPNVDGERLFFLAADAGAEDVQEDEETYEVRVDPRRFQAVHDALQEAGYEFERAEVTFVPTTITEVPDDKARQLLSLLEALDEQDDVQKIHSNFEVSDEVLATMEN
jgi:YebC/PmpR family DNA-binding regulatory protein